jgi:hypothetical protein
LFLFLFFLSLSLSFFAHSWFPLSLPKCDAIVGAGVQALITYIEDEENATVVCEQLQVCGNDVVSVLVQPLASDAECSTCVLLVSGIEAWLNDSKTEQAIESDLENYVCVLVPSFESTVSSHTTPHTPSSFLFLLIVWFFFSLFFLQV